MLLWVQLAVFFGLWAALGVAAARGRGPSVALDALLGVAGTLLLLIHAAFVDDPRWTRLMSVPEAWLWSNLAWPGACLLAALAWRRMKPGRFGGQRAFAAAALVLLGAWRGPSDALTRPPQLGPDRWEHRGPDAVCRQTTNATCGPAAVASAVRVLGIHTTETAMSRAALTSPAGTSDLGLYRALRLALSNTPHRVELYSGPSDTLEHFPAVLSLSSRAAATGQLVPVGARHAVALLRRDADGTVLVADPYSGLQRWTPDRLRELWPGRAFVVRTTPTAK